MRPGVLLGFIILWNVPLLLFLLWNRLTPPHRSFERMAILQALVLSGACIAVAYSPRLHRFVFRRGTPETQFRVALSVAAGFGLLIATVIWLTTFVLA